VVVPFGDVDTIARASAQRLEKEARTRAVLASGVLGLDYYGMREKLVAKGLRYADAQDE
jgi:4-hydroxy-4-methyl-2-oxoglutarate aldolase